MKIKELKWKISFNSC